MKRVGVSKGCRPAKQVKTMTSHSRGIVNHIRGYVTRLKRRMEALPDLCECARARAPSARRAKEASSCYPEGGNTGYCDLVRSRKRDSGADEYEEGEQIVFRKSDGEVKRGRNWEIDTNSTTVARQQKELMESE